MKIAIAGAGISGLVCGYLLHRDHDITVFEANSYPGGHTNTVDVEIDGEKQSVDTGFIVFNEDYYPNFTRLLALLGVESQPTTMSLSVKNDATGLEYCGESPNHLFAQRRNLLRPSFYRMLRDIVRFQKQGVELLPTLSDEVSVAEFVARHCYSEEFYRDFLAPMVSALWSSPLDRFQDFPMRFVIDFFRNHGMMQLTRRPVWRVIRGGSKQYIGPLSSGFRDRIRLGSAVKSVRRNHYGIQVRMESGEEERFDEVIFACHADQALALLDDPTQQERELLGRFPYQENDTVLHTDMSVLPRNRRAWGCWNYHMTADSNRSAAVTYNMNLLQGLKSKNTFCVSLNENGIDPAKVIRRISYHHPIFLRGRDAAQKRHAELIRQNRTSYCGAYWGFGFHEDGVRSALAVCNAFGKKLTA